MLAMSRPNPTAERAANQVTGAQSIVKAMMLLELFTTERTELTVGAAASALDIPKPSAHRLLSVLCQRSLLRQDKPGGPYALGPRVVALAAAYRHSQPLSTIALPHMRALLGEVDQTINLYVRLNDTRVVIERLQSSHGLQLVRPGDPLPLGVGAAGKVLAMSDDAARAAGVVVTRGERVPGACGIAAPIFNQSGKVIAALDIAGPLARMNERTIKQCSLAVLQTAQNISKDLGDPETSAASM